MPTDASTAPEVDLDRFDWSAILAALDARGHARLPGLLDAQACRTLAGLYEDRARFRSHIRMQRHGFGSGEYRYFAYPLPPPLASLRAGLYARLRALAERWQAALGRPQSLPGDHAAYLRQCHAAGQNRPTPLLLRYGPGDYNCLHQDLYGDLVFPLQATVLLSRPGIDFEGGEFVLTEQRPRMQSRVEVVPLELGDAVLFAVDARPQQGTRGYHRVRMRHGVSQVRAGRRHALGAILHDAG